MPVVTPTVSDSNFAQRVGNGDPQGVVLQPIPGGLLGFFGDATPVAQPVSNAFAGPTRGQAAGAVMAFTSVQSPTTVAPGTTQEFVVSALLGTTAAVSVGGTDVIYVNKPTSQAGLGIGNVRVVGTNAIAVGFFNLSGTTITPTASQQYQVMAIRGFNPVTATLSPAAVNPNTTSEQLFSVVGIRSGELVQVNKAANQAGLDIVGCRAVGNNQLGITFMNDTAATITPTASEAYTVYSLAGMDAQNNEVTLQIAASPTSVSAFVTTTEYLMPVTGMTQGDTVLGISKPSAQNGLGIVGMRVSIPSTVGVQFINTLGTTTTPTAGEVYSIAVKRQNPVAPLVLYSAALTPTSVPGRTTQEQTFTVTGLVANSAVWVNKPSSQLGLGIAGVRVSGANTLAINFSNTNANSVLPTAGETYLVGNFQEPAQTGGTGLTNAVIKSAVGVIQQSANMLGGMANSLGPSGSNFFAIA